MPRPLFHALASIPILTILGVGCGAFIGLYGNVQSVELMIDAAILGAWFCVGRHGPEVFIATMIYCWLFYRRRSRPSSKHH